MLTRRDALRALTASTVALATGRQILSAAPAPKVVVHKDPGCGCCDKWADHLRQAGFTVEVTEDADRVTYKKRLGIPEDWQTCHTGVVDGFVADGHVPADLIAKMLRDKPAIRGIGVPGMPLGSPGMEMPNGRKQPYEVLAFTKSGRVTVYAKR